jgi:hypothetical protein
MRRFHVTSAAVRHGRGLFAASRKNPQRQHEHVLSTVHGAGLVRHDGQPGGAFQPTKAPDLQHTDVHHGFGTSDKDPYTRTLPNMPLAPPESTVITNGAVAASPTLDEVRSLAVRWGSLGYWINDGPHARLPLYLDSLRSRQAMACGLTPDMEAAITSLDAQLAGILSQYGCGRSKAEVMEIFMRTSTALDTLAVEHLFEEPQVFDEKVGAVVEKLLADMTVLGVSVPELESIALALGAKCGGMRNKRLEELAAFLRHPDMANTHAAWQTFFLLAEQSFDGLGLPKECRFVWDHRCRSARLPAMTAPVALYFALCCASLANPEKSATGTCRGPLDAPATVKKAFLRHTLPALLASRIPEQFITSLRENGASNDVCQSLTLHSLSNYAAANADAAESAKLTWVFEDSKSADFYLQLLIQNCDKPENASTKQLLVTIFELSQTEAIDVRGGVNSKLRKMKWAQHFSSVATQLLSHHPTTELMTKLIANDSRSGSHIKKIHESLGTHSKALEQLVAQRAARESSRRQRAANLVGELSDYASLDVTLRALLAIGVGLGELEAAAADAEAVAALPPILLDQRTVAAVLRQISIRHPSWVTSSVFSPSSSHSISAPGRNRGSMSHAERPTAAAAMLPNLVRMFIRLTWMPHAGEALVKARSRRRIGPVGLEPYQQNIPVEIGQVEAYDNLQHKRWDWQGWYQRMVDVHNRNISLRCRMPALKQLDSDGRPFVDMQGERRLRVVAAERVGMDMLKLDSDRFEDQADNLEFGLGKFSEVIADARKTNLGEEYWPTVEVKVRRPSGQTKMRYSLVDDARIEAKSKELYERYAQAKTKKVFVTPMDTWLDIAGLTASKATGATSEEGYSIEGLYATMQKENASGDEASPPK